MDVVAQLIELRPGSGEQVQKWAETIRDRQDEAIATLRDEGVKVESWFRFSLDSRDYLLCYMRTESMERATDVVRGSPHAIDEYHRQFKQETWVPEGSIRGELLVDLATIQGAESGEQTQEVDE